MYRATHRNIQSKMVFLLFVTKNKTKKVCVRRRRKYILKRIIKYNIYFILLYCLHSHITKEIRYTRHVFSIKQKTKKIRKTKKKQQKYNTIFYNLHQSRYFAWKNQFISNICLVKSNKYRSIK